MAARTGLWGILAVLAGLALSSPSDAQQAGGAPMPAVTVVRAALQPVAASDVFTGRVEAVTRIDLRARVSGFVESVGFEEGGRVSAGDVLFAIEPDAYEAAVTRIEGQVKSAEAEKTLADIEVARQQTLLSSNTVAENVVQRAVAEQGKVEGQLLELQGALREAELDLSYTRVTAPFDGRVGLSEIDPGAFVGPDSGALVTLTSIDPVYVTFPVSESVFITYRERQGDNPDRAPLAARLTLANGSDYGAEGRIAIVDTTVQAGTDAVLIRASFPNPDGDLLDGQLVNITLVEDSDTDVLTVPVQALQQDQGGYFVLTVGDDGTVVRNTLVVDRIAGATVVVADGLAEGDRVIIEGMQRVRAGIVVDAEEKSESAAGAVTTTGSGN